MYANHQYDMDCITFSPQGRIMQIVYAMEAVKQGTPILAVRSETTVVLAAFKRAQSELAEAQKKIFKIDDHMCIGIAGLTADARVLAEYMRDECLNHRYIFDKPMMVGRLVNQVADKSQLKTQNSSKRPYGVGLLVVGCDENGPHIYETCPSGNYFEYYSMAIGGRSTSAKTYLENHFEELKKAESPEVLIQHAVQALNATAPSDSPLTVKNTSVAVISLGDKFKELSDSELETYISKLQKDVAMDDAPAGGAAGGEAPTPMETDTGATA